MRIAIALVLGLLLGCGGPPQRSSLVPDTHSEAPDPDAANPCDTAAIDPSDNPCAGPAAEAAAAEARAAAAASAEEAAEAEAAEKQAPAEGEAPADDQPAADDAASGEGN
ncbi:MAG: hypothetical protein KC620_23175 [Myxococcales bacterium]|nr:hypothetical protein [Myxococcales bacterium]